MKVPIELSRVLDRGGNPTVRELLSSIVFNPSNGTISLNGARIVMQRTAVSTALRSELIRLLGVSEARVFLMRLGYLSGQSDARFVRASWPNLDARDAFTAGTRLHTFSGVVRVETVFNTYDFRKKKLTAEFLWHDSVEAAEFHSGRPSPDPVCWTQLGYASGYASEFFDTLIVYKELECAGQGHSHCRVIGKHAEGWGANDPDVALFRDRILASPDAAQGGALRQPRETSAETGLNDLDLVLLEPVRVRLDHLAPMTLPVLICGASGTGRCRAAQYLHDAGAARAAEMRLIFGAEVDLQLCAEIARPAKAGKRGTGRNTVIIDGIEDVAPALQSQLARAIEHGITHGGPRIIALAQEDSSDSAPALSPELRAALSGLVIRMPRFCERNGQLRAIVRALLPMLASRLGMDMPVLDDAAAQFIEACAWPGNLHQMRRVLTAALGSQSHQGSIRAEDIESQLASTSVTGSGNAAAPASNLADSLVAGEEFSLPDFEQSIYRAALERAGGNLSAAARVLGLTRAQLAYRVNCQSDAKPDKAP